MVCFVSVIHDVPITEQGQVGHGRGHFLGNDDICDRTLVI